MRKIESLTDAQKSRFQEYREKWIRIGLSTEPADRGAAERGIAMSYQEAGLNPPGRFLWLDSPLRGAVAYSLLSGASVRASVWGSVRDSVRASVRASVGDGVGAGVWASVRASVGASVWASVRASVGASVWGSVRDSVRASVGDGVGGSHEAPWMCFYDYFGDVCDLAVCKRLDGLSLAARSCGWWWPLSNLCICTERHCEVRMDVEGRLHNESGLAVAYPDGWGVYSWHGVRVPKNVIESPETLTVEQVKAESNAEVRRVMMERIGWERFCREARMRVIHEDELHSNFPSIPQSEYVQEGQRFVYGYRPGVERAQLLESEELRDLEDRPLRFVRLADPSTGREYTIRVRHDHTRCYEAVGASFGVSETEYRTGHYVRQGDVFLKALGKQQIQQHS